MTYRQCGECNLCCKLVPVPDMDKLAGERCRHQRATGCRIYAQRPQSCALWNCVWLGGGDQAADLRRPDRVHYVIDVLPDFITLQDNDTGEARKIPVLQIWLDPDYPDAHRDPGLRAYLDNCQIAGLVRTDAHEAFVLFPPSMAEDREWHEMKSGRGGREHTKDEIASAMREAGIEVTHRTIEVPDVNRD
jgi:hypothetical protein